MTSIIISALTCFLLLPLILPYLKGKLVDIPGNRSSHSKPTPRGGGVSFVFVSILLSLLFYPTSSNPLTYLILAALPLSVIGFVDDFIQLSVFLRLVFQTLTVFCIVYMLPLPTHHQNSFWILLLMPIMITIINFVNFTDGLDGLLTGCVIITLLCAVINSQDAQPLSCIVGALLGFLPWNWSPAKVFMGDVGSLFLGVVLSGTLFYLSSSESLHISLSLLLVMTPLFSDASLCLIYRLISRQSIFQAHRLHLYQRLNQAGWSHSHVSILYIINTSLLAFAFLKFSFYILLFLCFSTIVFGFYLHFTYATPLPSKTLLK